MEYFLVNLLVMTKFDLHPVEKCCNELDVLSMKKKIVILILPQIAGANVSN